MRADARIGVLVSSQTDDTAGQTNTSTKGGLMTGLAELSTTTPVNDGVLRDSPRHCSTRRARFATARLNSRSRQTSFAASIGTCSCHAADRKPPRSAASAVFASATMYFPPTASRRLPRPGALSPLRHFTQWRNCARRMGPAAIPLSHELAGTVHAAVACHGVCAGVYRG